MEALSGKSDVGVFEISRRKLGICMNKSQVVTAAAKTATITAGWRCAWLALALLGTQAHAQTAPAVPAPQAPGPADQTSTFNTNADEVSLDLVVRDKRHKPIFDLRPEDIAITDEGTPVKLQAFRLVKGDMTAGHVITLVFDRFDGALAKSARLMAEKVLKTLPSNGYSIAVMDLGGRLRLLQDFTQDRAAVDQAINVATDSNVTRLVSTASLGVNITQDKAEPGRAKVAEKA